MMEGLCRACGRTYGEHAFSALTSENPHGWKWQENACPVGTSPFHPEQTFTTSAIEPRQESRCIE